MQAKLFLSIQSLSQKALLYKASFEHYYYKFIRHYDNDTRSKINFAVTVISGLFIGYVYNFILTLWKPMYQWSFIELGGIGYFAFRTGSRLGETIHQYLEKVSKGLFDHTSYHFKPLKPIASTAGSSYLNPIDLTMGMDTAEEREALEALRLLSQEDTGEDTDKDTDEDTNTYTDTDKKTN